MEIFYILRSHPLNGLALLVSLAVIVWSLFMVRRVGNPNDRILTGLVGLTAVFQGLHLLVGAGLFFQTSRSKVDDIVNLFVAGIYLAVLWYLKKISGEYLAMRFALRLAEGNQALPMFHARPVRKPSFDSSATLLDAVPMAMFAVSLDGNVSCWNLAAEKTLGWTRDEVIGQKLPNMVMEPQPGGAIGCIRLLRKNGEAVQSEFRSVAIRDSKGSVNGILTIVQT